jgi:hypothetical protein
VVVKVQSRFDNQNGFVENRVELIGELTHPTIATLGHLFACGAKRKKRK